MSIVLEGLVESLLHCWICWDDYESIAETEIDFPEA